MKILKRILLNVFPPPRQPVQWIDALPLAMFLVLFVGLCLFLELRHVLLFARPGAFVFALATVWNIPRRRAFCAPQWAKVRGIADIRKNASR